MTSPDPNDPRLRMSRYLRRISTATRAISILVVIGACIFLLVALNMRSSDDRVGFSLIALAVILFAVLVWGAGTFHGAAAEALPTLVSVDRKLDQLGWLLTSMRAAAPPTAPIDSEKPEELTAADIEPAPTAMEPAALALDAPAPPGPAPRAEKPEPAKSPCPHCGGMVHPEATRCVHCMKKIAR